MSVLRLTEMSRKYGAKEYVLGGGGNTSWKDERAIYVKASGTELLTIKPEHFAAMDLNKLTAILNKEYPKDAAAREASALKDMMAARLPGEQGKRPSVEALAHAVFPYKYVLHAHPALINGLSCGINGEQVCRSLFKEAVWIPLTKPGYMLGRVCMDALSGYERCPQIVILQNHGVFVAADTPDEIDTLMNTVITALENKIERRPEFDEAPPDTETACEIAPALRMLYSQDGKAVASFCVNRMVREFVAGSEAISPLMTPLTPEYVVHCGARPLFIESTDDFRAAFEAFEAENGRKPKIVAVGGVGFFALGKTAKQAELAKQHFLNSMEIAVYSEAFGGPKTLPEDFIDFILSRETECRRRKLLSGNAAAKRLEGKIAIVTGGAQGFGKGLARAMAKEGAYVVVADLNMDGAQICSNELNRDFGAYTSVAVRANVADEQSVKEMVDRAVLTYGGLDIMLSNAGVLFAGSLSEMTCDRFKLVTEVNYTGYFLCAKHASVPMKRQRSYSPSYMADILEINSKSGLEGSNKNFAYAGSKFGGIGLTQSFALELVEYGIKVNAICPGNLLDGPLWTDPERGLFRQYLDAGKVPGAKTIADVRAFYEAKVPMKRGCTPEDVALAILYAIEQKYETGQAIPVTGGQVMLK